LRLRIVQGDDELLAGLGGTFEISRPLARDGEPVGADAEAADVAAAWFDRGGADVRAAGADRRPAQLGLSLHLDPRRVVHALCPDAARLHRGSAGVHALDGG